MKAFILALLWPGLLVVANNSETVFFKSVAFQKSQNDPGIVWTDSADGFAIGYKPPDPLKFTPSKKWNGRIYGSSGSGPGGKWSEDASVPVFLKNTGTKPIWWSDSALAWRISVPEIRLSSFDEEWLRRRSLLPPTPTHPLLLEPEEVVQVSVPIAKAHIHWPLVKPGRYKLQVRYEPKNVPQSASGVPPGFWLGTIETPAFFVQVVH